MLLFREISLEDRQAFEQCVAAYNYHLCEHCFADIFIWRRHYHTQICFYKGFALLRSQTLDDGRMQYLAPIGDGDLADAILELQKDAAALGLSFIMTSIAEPMITRIEAAMPGAFRFTNNEDNNDYIYLSEKLQTLSGKKLQSKRNLVNRFQAGYEGRWRYEPLNESNLQEALSFHLKWVKDTGHLNESSYVGETCAINIALHNRASLGLVGGVLRLDGEVIAFSMGCQASNDLFVVQIEKADHTIPGAYQMINQQFVLHNCKNVTYVNREEDLGIEGLRKAKRSYYPEKMGIKYTAVPL